ncbi:MAG TPA: hypothetical protein VGU20_31860 [Stellaceae bacterium]|nr:hypothetical protein [Stellaceae bacterium]
MSSNEGCNRGTAAHFARDMIELAGAEPSHSITVIGCDHIELLLELAARGFRDVTCRRPLGGPAGEEPADIVVAPAISEKELAEMLPRLSRAMRPDGALLISTAERSLPFSQRTYDFLAEHGFAIARVAQPDRLSVLCCRKYAMLQAQAA